LLGAAVLARCAHDHATVARFARAAHEVEPSLVSARLLGEALYELGRQQDALDVLTAVPGLPGAADHRFELGFARAHTLFWGLPRHDEALDALRALADDPALAHRRVDVERRRAVLAAYLGRIADAADALASVPDFAVDETSTMGSEVANCRHTIAIMSGHPADAMTLAEAAWARYSVAPDLAATVNPLQHRMNIAWSLME